MFKFSNLSHLCFLVLTPIFHVCIFAKCEDQLAPNIINASYWLWFYLKNRLVFGKLLELDLVITPSRKKYKQKEYLKSWCIWYRLDTSTFQIHFLLIFHSKGSKLYWFLVWTLVANYKDYPFNFMYLSIF